uniref:Condensin-2 complex subunit H2 n=1 Tax=Astyanax mexicanus TaxID=7994 RepID=A0A8B9JN23_ASTMX
MDSAETRFAHLLQPIREMTKNWDVDLATQLGEYLEELDQMTISFDGGKTTMNFAEAALLIQGSTCIYGRKVELLHNLVFQTLDCISNKNKNSSSVFFQPVKIGQLPPESLIPAEALEKQKYPLLSLKGEILGSLKDFRINNFTVDSLGMICLGSNSSSQFQREALGDGLDSPGRLPLILQEEMVGLVNNNCGDDDNDGGEPLPPLEDHGMEVEADHEEHVERHQEVVDPWKWLDPYETTDEDKPLKTGKCCNVPAGLEESGKRKRKGPSKLQDFLGWYETTDRKLKNGPLFPEFSYIYLSKMNQRLKTRKRILRKTGVYMSDEVLKRTFLEPEKPEDQDEVPRHPDMDGDDYSDHENEVLFEDHAPGDFAEQDQVLTDSQMSRMSYEDLVRKNVELFLVNSQKYAQETALSLRVKEWEDEINPRLSAQENRPAFDIHDYGDRIVHALGDVGVKRSFASLVAGMENTEACRYMLASLQLANDYTVQIDKKDGLEECVDTMELTLLSKQRATERLKNYNASSDHNQP